MQFFYTNEKTNSDGKKRTPTEALRRLNARQSAMSSGDEQKFEESSGMIQDLAELDFDEEGKELTDEEAEEGA